MEKYDYICDFYDGLARVKLNNKYGFINKQGVEIIQCQYDWVYSFYEGFAMVKLNNKWGFINQEGKEVIPCKYDDTHSFNENYYIGKINNKYFLIDKNNYNTIECTYKLYENIGSRDDDLEVFYTNDYNIILFNTGCFRGDLQEFKEAEEDTHNNEDNMKYYNEYMDVIKEYEKVKL